ncbi:MAG: ParB/RepB/Spo0J family partition protein, partial [Oscillospiraceae bacterium]|nr:ParB/RepB/Spo0J family partition protein [Oscillospiraceae bacterium]
VIKGEEMEKMIESVRQFGVITPAVARPLSGSKYEIVSGHRRLEACRKLGIETMPVVVREMTDDEAVIAMVDANLQRETILPSEKAFAYKMKLEALKHQGKTSPQLAQKLSVEIVADEAEESKDQIRRYIRLTNLTPELLEMVDEGKIAFSPAVEISFLTENEQRLLLDAMDMNNCTPSHAQSIRLKKLSQEGSLTDEMIENIMSEEKPNQKENIKFKREDFKKFFPPSYTDKQMKADILKGLELLQRQRERNRDAR